MANAKKGLGKGIGALISKDLRMEALEAMDTPERAGDPLVFEVDLSRIRPNPDQPRKCFDKIALNELAESIKNHGILQPLVVSKDTDGFTIIAGERRFRAANIAGLKTVPVILKDLSPREVMEIALIENVQREDLNPIEEAMAYELLVKNYEMTQNDLADRLGKSRTAITNTLRLLKLPEIVREQVLSGGLTAGHARAILGLEKEEDMIALGKRAEQENLTVRETENAVKGIRTGSRKKTKSKKTGVDPYLKDVEEQLKSRLNTAVHIKGDSQKGKLEIDYYNEVELTHLYELLMEQAQ